MDSIGKYSIEGIQSQDDTGVLYHAVDTVLDRDVSIKVIHKHFVESEEARNRFFEEARAAMRLTHENIAPLHDVSEHDGQLYLVMEYLDGHDLTTVRDAGIRIPLIDKLRFAHQMARGLKYAHDHGIVHGQLRPEAIVIIENGELKIQGFVGAPKKAGSENTKSAAGTLVDMLDYLSPEHVQESELDARSDIFSFGSILYELLQGEPPFRASRKSDVIENILHRAPPDMDRDPGAGSTEAEQIVFNCLAKDPEDRYPSCDDLLRHLEALIDALAGSGPSLDSDRLRNILAETADPNRDVNAVSHVVLTSSGDFETRTVEFEVSKGSGKDRSEYPGEREDRLGYRMMSPADLARPRKQRRRRIMMGVAAVVVPVLALIVWFFILPDDPASEGSGAAAEGVQSASTTATVASDVTITLSEPRDTLISPASGARFGGDASPTLTIFNPPALGTATVEQDSLIRYSPAANVSGDDEMGYALTWPSGRVEQGQIRVTIPSESNTAPAFTSRPDETSIDVGGFFSYDIVADDPDGDGMTISSLSTIPSWMRFVDRGNGTASLRGTPTAENAGRYPITLEVSDGSAANEQRFTVTVESAGAPATPAPTPTPTPAAQPVGAPSGSSPADGATGLDTVVPLSWSSVPGADLYRAQVSLNPAFSAIVADGSTSSTSWTATGLAENTEYYWRVRASRDRNPGAWSTVRSFTTRVAGNALVQSRIDQYISELDTAFEQRDADGLEEVHPDYDDWYFQLFSASTQYEASFDASDIEVDGSRATARVTITVTYDGGQDIDTRIWTLVEQGGAWQLQSMEKL